MHRRNGKPTSLGCFDHEEEASRAYDKMMLWCELHHSTGVKGGITNFDPAEYEADIPWLQSITQVPIRIRRPFVRSAIANLTVADAPNPNPDLSLLEPPRWCQVLLLSDVVLPEATPHRHRCNVVS